MNQKFSYPCDRNPRGVIFVSKQILNKIVSVQVTMDTSVSGEFGLVISSVNEQLYTGFYKGPKEMNENKFVRDVFKKGDRFFSFGDLVYLDKDYNIYFRDRIGDTFRLVKRCML